MDTKNKAIDKATVEINKNITELANLLKKCTLSEFQHFLYCLKVSRIYTGNYKNDSEKHLKNIEVLQYEDAIKYIIQLSLKYSSLEYKFDKFKIKFNYILVSNIIEYGINIIKRFDALSVLKAVNRLTVSGDRNQHVKIDLSEEFQSEVSKKIFLYGARVEIEHYEQKKNVIVKDDFLKLFRDEYNKTSYIFEKEFKISLDDFTESINIILNLTIKDIKNKIIQCDYLENGNIDPLSFKTMMVTTSAYFFEKNQINKIFKFNFREIFNRLFFDNNSFNDKELQFDLIARKPFMENQNFYIFCPELILDSLIVNSHYSLLESGKYKDEYKKISSNLFLDKIVEISKNYGYIEVDRELDLFEGKNQIGDLDLVLKKNNHFLIIEAKNHSLPLAVSFGSREKIIERLKYLKKDWEEKVIKRVTHLKTNSSNYNVNENFSYIIVSKEPEILSHFSNILTLSLFEYNQWLNLNDLNIDFEKFHELIYDSPEKNLEENDFKELMKNYKSFWRFEKE